MSLFFVSDDKSVEERPRSTTIPGRSGPQQRPDKERSTVLMLQALFCGPSPKDETNAKNQQISSTETPNPKFSKLTELATVGDFINHVNGLDEHGIRNNCPVLRSVTIEKGADEVNHREISTFISNLRSDSLTRFECRDNAQLDAIVLSSLVNHCTSLKSLKLALKDLNKLQHLPKCPNLENLYINSFSLMTELNELGSTGMDSWLGHCKSLKILELNDFQIEPSAIINLLLNEEILLESLYISYSNNVLNREFYRVLATKASLNDLHLETIDSPYRDDREKTHIMEGLLGLGSLQRLSVRNVRYFEDHDIMSIAQRLTRLQSLTFECEAITGTIWSNLSNLANLHELKVAGNTEFTLDDIFSYVSRLGTGNDRLVVKIDTRSKSSMNLKHVDVERAHKSLKEKVNGSFCYVHDYVDDGEYPYESESEVEDYGEYPYESESEVEYYGGEGYSDPENHYNQHDP